VRYQSEVNRQLIVRLFEISLKMNVLFGCGKNGSWDTGNLHDD